MPTFKTAEKQRSKSSEVPNIDLNVLSSTNTSVTAGTPVSINVSNQVTSARVVVISMNQDFFCSFTQGAGANVTPSNAQFFLGAYRQHLFNIPGSAVIGNDTFLNVDAYANGNVIVTYLN